MAVLRPRPLQAKKGGGGKGGTNAGVKKPSKADRVEAVKKTSRAPKGDSHHCWKCNKAATARCVSLGHIHHCKTHNRYYGRGSNCRECDRVKEAEAKDDADAARAKRAADRAARQGQ